MSGTMRRVGDLLPAGALGLFCAFVVVYPLTDPDIFWHLAAGREMIARKAFFFVDPFSYTLDHPRWLDFHWLFQIIVFTLQKLTGNTGLLAAKGLMFGGAAVAMFLSVPAGRARAWVLAPATALLLFETRFLVPMRPVLFSLLFMAVYVCALERFMRSRRFRNIASLVPVQIAWVNSQGLFLLGPAIALAYFAGDIIDGVLKGDCPERAGLRQKLVTYGIALGAVLLACLVNPYGLVALSFPLELLGRIEPSLRNIYAVNIPENIPLLNMIGTRWERYVYVVGAVTLVALLSFAFAGRRFRSAHVLLLAQFFLLAYMAQRNIVLYFFALIPVLVWNFGNGAPLMIRVPGRLGRWLPVALPVLLFAAVSARAAAHRSMLARSSTPQRIAPFSHPVHSVSYLEQHPIEGNLFNADRHGGYILWKMYPGRRVFIDTRLIIRSRQFFAEYLAILDNPELFDVVQRRFNITHAILPTALVDRYIGLARKLYRDPDWRLVYADGAEALFVLDSLASTGPLELGSRAVVDSAARALRRRWEGAEFVGEESQLHFAGFLSAMGFREEAASVLAGLNSPAAAAMNARLLSAPADWSCRGGSDGAAHGARRDGVPSGHPDEHFVKRGRICYFTLGREPLDRATAAPAETSKKIRYNLKCQGRFSCG